MWTISNNKDWTHLRKFRWVEDMHGVPQSSVHHAEGDVAIHTQMVLSVLSTLPEFAALDAQEKEILWASALLHDVEKRSATIIDERGEITSPGHARKGAMTVRQLLYREIPAPFELREQVVGLVRHHGLPLWIMEREDPVRTLLKVSLEVNTEWLYILSLADALGRICADTDDLLYRLALFKALCIEQNCWGQERRFATAAARFSYFRKADQSADFVPYEDKADEVVILSGIAGSGKDHYIAQHYNNMPVISLDDMRRKGKIDRRDTRGNGRIIQAATEQARQYLRSAIPFVWNATNITLQMREQLVNTFAVYKPFIRLVYLEVPYAVLISQNKCREGSLPQAAIDRMIERLEVPKLWEAHEVQYIVR